MNSSLEKQKTGTKKKKNSLGRKLSFTISENTNDSIWLISQQKAECAHDFILLPDKGGVSQSRLESAE